MAGTSTNQQFELRGFNHVAFVARDMAETVAWYESVLGMRLVKTLQFPNGGQHFFLDMGNGVDGIAFFWWPDAPEGTPGEAIHGTFDDQMRPVGRDVTAIGTMNHIAFDVPADKMEDYREKLRSAGVATTEIFNHANSLAGAHKADYDPAADQGDVFVRSMYFKDPNGVLLEFAAWTATFDEGDVVHAAKTVTDRHDAPSRA